MRPGSLRGHQRLQKGTTMVTTKTGSITPEAAQDAFTKKLEDEHFDFGLIVGDAFVRGIRDIGYKHTGTALDEHVDNSIQAGATRIDVIFGFEGSSDKKPDRIAVLDNGHGMDPRMIRVAMLWGGTHREGDRTGFGRYGYGLPSASVSQGKVFSVYSRRKGGEWHMGTFDLRAVGRGDYNDASGKIIMPAARPAALPAWVKSFLREHVGADDLEHGTIVVMEELDRLSWKTARSLKVNLLEHFGVTYRNFLRDAALFVDGTKVEAVDPLFITPGMRLFDLDEDRALALEPMVIPVKNEDGTVSDIRVRFSYLPPTFQSKDKTHGGAPTNARFGIMKQYTQGIIVGRAGRQIDTITSGTPWTGIGTFVNYDRNWGVEIDFSPGLDEEFSITTSKQRVILSDRIWDILEQAGVKAAITQLRKRFREDKARLRAVEAKEGEPRASEKAMELAQKFKTRRTTPSPEQQEQQETKLKQEARKRARSSGVSPDQVEEELRREAEDRPYKIDFESHPGGPFFRVDQIGGQRVLYLNTSHRFFRDLYSGPDSTPRLRAALEVLLFVIGDGELDAQGQADRRLFYESERGYWSQQLNVALDRLDQMDSVEDELSASEEDEDEEIGFASDDASEMAAD